jgi:ubiquitin C-terminal hydrolase
MMTPIILGYDITKDIIDNEGVAEEIAQKIIESDVLTIPPAPSPPEYAMRGVCGLVNVGGNSCYINSALQCLNATDLFVAYLRMGFYKRDLKFNIVKEIQKSGQQLTIKKINERFKKTYTYLLRNLFFTMWGAKVKINYATFAKKIQSAGQTYIDIREQGDSQEFLAWIIDLVHEETKISATIRPLPDDEDGVFLSLYKSITLYIILDKMCDADRTSVHIDLIKRIFKDRTTTFTLDELFEEIPTLLSDTILTPIVEKQFNDLSDGDEPNNINKMRRVIKYLRGEFQRIQSDHPKKFKIFIEWYTWNEKINVAYGSKTGHSIIDDLFMSIKMSSRECDICRTVHFTFNDTMSTLNLPFNPKQSELNVKDCIKNYFSDELIDIEEKRYCTVCGNNSGVGLKHKFVAIRLAPILILFFSTISYATVNVPSVLDMSEYTDDVDDVYDLYAVSLKSGSTNGGHYETYAKNDYNDKWYEYNDTIVNEFPNEEFVMANLCSNPKKRHGEVGTGFVVRMMCYKKRINVDFTQNYANDVPDVKDV